MLLKLRAGEDLTQVCSSHPTMTGKVSVILLQFTVFLVHVCPGKWEILKEKGMQEMRRASFILSQVLH